MPPHPPADGGHHSDGCKHRFLVNDVSLADGDVPSIAGHRQVTDAVLLTVARRAGMPLATFDASLAALAGDNGSVELLHR